jgi:GR25 family glycosyltransferase involved in LPS biosynthesis
MLVRFLKLSLISALLIVFAAITVYPGAFILSSGGDNISLAKASPPYQGIGAYVINLAHSQARYNYIAPKVAALNLPWQRLDAVYGAELSQEQRDNIIDLENYHIIVRSDPSPGTIGCSLSHIKAWQQFLLSNYEYALIFEDDVTFEPELLAKILEELQKKPQLWDIVSFDIKKNGTPLPIGSLAEQHNLVIYLSAVSNAGGYLLNRQAAEKMLAKALPIKMPIDYFFTRSWEFGLRFTGVEPRIVKQKFGDSEIRNTDKHNKEYTGNKGRDTIEQAIRKRVYTNESEIVRFVYNLWIYFKS